MHKIIHPIIVLIALVCGCFVEDFKPIGETSSTGSGSGASADTSSTSEQSVDPDLDLALEPDEQQRVCPDKWCAGSGYFVDCACQTESPYEGTTVCCDNPTNDRLMVGTSCPADKITFSCRRDNPLKVQDPLWVPPTSCTNGFDFTCPGGYSAKPTDPAESGCVGVTVNEECAGGGAQSCASVC